MTKKPNKKKKGNNNDIDFYHELMNKAIESDKKLHEMDGLSDEVYYDGFGDEKKKGEGYLGNELEDEDSLDSEDDQVVSVVVDGYRQIYNAFDVNTTVVMFDFQPSFREQIETSIDIDIMVNTINTFVGRIVSVFTGESRGMESEEILNI